MQFGVLVIWDGLFGRRVGLVVFAILDGVFGMFDITFCIFEGVLGISDSLF